MQFNKALRHTILWKVMNTIVLFCINLLMVRMMGAGQSGAFYYDITVLAMLALLQGFSLESGTVFFKSKQSEDGNAFAAALILWLVLQVFIGAVVLLFINVAIAPAAALVFVISNIAITFFGALFAANKVFLLPNIISTGVNLLLLLILLFLFVNNKVYTGGSALPVYLYMYSFAMQALLFAVFFYYNYKQEVSIAAVNVAVLKKLFAFSGVAFAGNLLFFLLTRVDYYFVNKYCTTAALGNYIQVSRLGQLLVLLPSMIAAVLFPYTAGAEEKMFLEKTQFFCRVLTWVFIPLMLGLAATGFWLFPLLFGDDFSMMYTALLFYMPGFFALSIITVLAAYTGGRGMVGSNLAATALALAIMVTGDVLLIPLCGIDGAAISSSLAYLACLIWLLLSLKRKEYFFTTDFFGFRLSDLKRLTSML
ncbi:MAG: oligosaccharide flippase family protein [Ferruginibacter sp.]